MKPTNLLRVLLLFFLLAGFATTAAAQAPASNEVAAALAPFVKEQTLAGAVVLVADRDRVLCTEAVGFADVAGKVPMRPDALFWIASQSKPITATALMILVDEGKVKIEDPVEKYLPEFKGIWVIAEQDKEHLVLKRPKRPKRPR